MRATQQEINSAAWHRWYSERPSPLAAVQFLSKRNFECRMSEHPDKPRRFPEVPPHEPALQYASPQPCLRRGELGALPALLCVVAWLFGCLALLFAVLAGAAVVSFRRFEELPAVLCVALTVFGTFCVWAAIRVDRRYRKRPNR